MKKILILLLVLFIGNLGAQITFDNSYTSPLAISLDKLQFSGYKYVKVNIQNLKIELYNINHSLFKTISIPTQTAPIQSVSYVSENLFDTDNLVEFVVSTYTSSFSGPSQSFKAKVQIYKENGTLLFSRDSTSISQSNNPIFNNTNGIYFDGQNTKMRLQIYAPNFPSTIKTEIYTLPGSIPCIECSSTGTVSGISSPGNPGQNNPIFYPNPVTDQLKLKYELPKDYKTADINIYDLQGKLIETFKVTDTFDFIYLPSDYNNGLYLYTLNVDGKAIKTEKIILNK
ncbi:MAG TPA: T9SS type A sorting domain-containing protein [Bacteroidia bacterium]|nr:T9SS type A sorting domain-containing protein [Bacteroidia bacterium]